MSATTTKNSAQVVTAAANGGGAPAVATAAANGGGAPATVTKLKLPKAVKPAIDMLPVGQVQMVAPGLLNIQPGMNPREFHATDEADKAFAESLREGVRKPLEVRQDADGKLWVMDGHRRLGAIRYLATEAKTKKVIATVPVIRLPDERVSDEGKKGAVILSSANFRNLTPMQQGVVAARMLAEGWAEKAIAQAAGKTKEHIKFVLAMQGIPTSVARFVTPDSETGIASYTALQIVKEVGAERAEKAIVKALDKLTREKGFGARLRVTRKHLHAADEGIPLEVGGNTATAQRAPQQTVAPAATTPKPGTTTPAPATATSKPATTPAPVKPAKPVLEVNGFRVRTIDGHRVIATFDSGAEATHYLPYLTQGFASAPVPRPLAPATAALSVKVARK